MFPSAQDDETRRTSTSHFSFHISYFLFKRNFRTQSKDRPSPPNLGHLCYNEKSKNRYFLFTLYFPEEAIMHIHVIDHPLIQHKLTIMRKKETSSGEFRRLLQEITLLMGYELTRDLPLEDVAIETPLEKATGKQVAGKKLGIVPILRAGFGMVEGLTELMPSARIGVIGLYRDPVTAKPIEYYCKLPDVENRDFILVDPMLATGGSAVAAIDMMKEKGVKNIKFMCLVAAPEGVEVVNQAHPDVPIYTASLDRQLNEKKYILPGLGDAGDRIFGTK